MVSRARASIYLLWLDGSNINIPRSNMRVSLLLISIPANLASFSLLPSSPNGLPSAFKTGTMHVCRAQSTVLFWLLLCNTLGSSVTKDIDHSRSLNGCGTPSRSSCWCFIHLWMHWGYVDSIITPTYPGIQAAVVFLPQSIWVNDKEVVVTVALIDMKDEHRALKYIHGTFN